MTVDFVSQINAASSYKLMELTPELLEELQNGGTLTMKCPSTTSDVVICSKSATFRLRQMNQTNTLLLVRPEGDGGNTDEDGDTNMDATATLTGFGSVANYLEPVKFEGMADFSRIPRYFGDGVISEQTQDTAMTFDSLNALRKRSLICDVEFDNAWYQHAGIEKDGIACLIDDKLLQTLLEQLLLSVVSSRLGMKGLELEAVYKAFDTEEPREVVHSVLRRFSKQREEPFDLDGSEIVKWLGLQVLRTNAGQTPIAFEQFQQLWKQAVPIEHDWELDLSKLVGNYVQPTGSTIRYLTRFNLSDNPKIRFQQLLSVKSSWELQEMVPFIDDLRNKAVKLESFVMKYARKKTVGKKVFISARAGA